MKLKVFIAEDSQENIDTLRIMLKAVGDNIEIAQIAKSLADTERIFREDSFDLALLDIRFKKGTIFEVLDRLINDGVSLPEIVFVTAHGSFEYATKAIKYACLDFINKPIDPIQLTGIILQSMEKIQSREEQNQQLKLLIDLLEGDINKPATVAVVLPKKKIAYIRMDELMYAVADGNTSIFHLSNRSFHSTRHLGYYIDLFQGIPDMIQISRACIVNRQNVQGYDSSSRELTMKNGDKIQASHRASKNLKRRIVSQPKSSIAKGLEKLKSLIK